MPPPPPPPQPNDAAADDADGGGGGGAGDVVTCVETPPPFTKLPWTISRHWEYHVKHRDTVELMLLVGSRLMCTGGNCAAPVEIWTKIMTFVLARPRKEMPPTDPPDNVGRGGTVETVNLAHNHIGDGGCIAFADMLKINRSIHTMSLEANQVGERGGFAMADAIWQNTTLLALNMADNDLGEAADYIREAWGDRSDGLVL